MSTSFIPASPNAFLVHHSPASRRIGTSENLRFIVYSSSFIVHCDLFKNLFDMLYYLAILPNTTLEEV
jgi:hypothetical protein